MKKILIGVVILAAVVVAYMMYSYRQTKSHSPEATVNYEGNGLTIHIVYNRPFKNGRDIFGGLVPYGEVWRTGANEATIFETNKDLWIKGKLLKAGKYTLWTIPGEQIWSVMFNSETGQWGIKYLDGTPNRDPAKDVLSVDVPTMVQDKEFEQFTISVEQVGEDLELVLLWDHAVISVPMSLTAP